MRSIIAIVGRPNVGKSTLFNRLSSKRKAIVIDEPGATRDRNYADCTWYEKEFTLVDTGGFEPASKEEILVQMREQTRLAIEEADAIIFLMDGKEGVTSSDKEIADLLRKMQKPVFYAVNKIDGLKHEGLAYDFFELGIDQLYPISAQHGVGIHELMDDLANVLTKTDKYEQTEGQRIRIAVIGKPNVGKSSLVNKILGYKRVIVNPLPGTTRDAIDTNFELRDRKYLLVDTAGIRRKNRITQTLEKYSVVQALKAIRRCDVALLLIDAQEGVTEQDAKIAGLTAENGTACVIVVNKWDLVDKNNSTVGVYVKDIKDKLKFMDYAPIIFVSAFTGQRVLKIFDIIEIVYEQFTKRVDTPEFNRIMREFIESNPPPRIRSKENSFLYMTQASIAPPTFVFFVREPKSVHFSYRRFLANRIRETLGFGQTPIRLIFKRKSG